MKDILVNGKEVLQKDFQDITYVNKIFPKEAKGVHFNLPAHKVSDKKITILQKLNTNNTEYRKEKEKYLINKFNTFYKGINREK